MSYTIGEMAKLLDVPASTLRYYDKEGLLPFVKRTDGGIRVFENTDFEWLQIINCMKKSGMSITDIREYIQLTLKGNSTIDARLEMFKRQKEVLEKQIEEMNETLKTLEYKCWFYETAKASGTTDVPKNMSEKDVPKKYRKIRKELKRMGKN